MSSWDMGYHSSSLYLHYYHYVFNPLWIKFILTANGCRVPNLDHGYACELGIGQGVSINMHALTSTTNWYGNDFNPSQVSFAQNLIPNKLDNLHIYDDSFEQFSKRDDLPDFAYIVIHGIWSWISPENQQYLIDFVNKHLKVGGVLFISYNIAPGHTAFEPTRHLMKSYMEQMLPHTLSDADQIHDIANFMQNLINTAPKCLGNYPNYPVMINSFFAQEPSYLMNEYFNQAWDITHFGLVEDKLDQIKLKFAASANGTNMIDLLNFDQEQLEFLTPLAGTAIFEDAKDFMINNKFRTDIFIKGPTFLTPMEQDKAFQKLSAVRTKPTKDFQYQLKRKFNDETLEMPREIYEPVLNFFGDYQVHSFGDAIAKLQGTEHNGYTITDQDVVDALLNLTAVKELLPAYPDAELSSEILERCQKYNLDYLTNRSDSPVSYLACPVIGGGLQLHPFVLNCLINYLKNTAITTEELHTILHQQVEDAFANVDAAADDKLEEKKQAQLKQADQIADDFLAHVLPCYQALKML